MWCRCRSLPVVENPNIFLNYYAYHFSYYASVVLFYAKIRCIAMKAGTRNEFTKAINIILFNWISRRLRMHNFKLVFLFVCVCVAVDVHSLSGCKFFVCVFLFCVGRILHTLTLCSFNQFDSLYIRYRRESRYIIIMLFCMRHSKYVNAFL